MDKTAKQDLIELIEKSENILITSHSNPDVDAVGSLLGLFYILKNIGKKSVTLVIDDVQPFNEDFLPGVSRISNSKLSKEISKKDLVIFLDGGEIRRFTEEKLDFDPSTQIARIDHHAGESNIQTNVEVVDPEISSTAELVFQIFYEIADIDKNTAICLLAGIYDDTNSFSTENVTNKTLEIASILVNKGAKVVDIAEAIYSYKEEVLNGTKALITNLRFDDKFKYSFSFISKDLYNMLELDGGKVDTILNLSLNILLGRNNYDWGFVVRPHRETEMKVSFRSRTTGENVRLIAQALGGGGHNRAAGAIIKTSDPYDAIAKVRRVIEEKLG